LKSVQCKFCNYKYRKDLETKILSGEITQTKAGEVIGVSYQSIRRHIRNHMSKDTVELAKTFIEDVAETSVGSVMEAEKELMNLIIKSKELIEIAEKQKDYRLMLLSMESARKCIETAGKLFADLIKPHQDNTVKIEIEFI